MSNHLAIATVTAALQRSLQAVVQADVEGARVTTVRPDAGGAKTPETGVNIFLYQVSPNAAWRNSDLRTRLTNDQLVKRPKAALDLFYLISFYGNETELEPQRLMGSVIRTLHAQAYLRQEMIQDTISDSTFAYLAGSDLGDQIEIVKFLPLTYTTDELSRVWSVLFQVPYALSLGYQASIVMIESDDIPQRALPVRDRRFNTGPNPPQIERVLNLEGPREPITLGSSLLILGQRLKGEHTQIRLGDTLVSPQKVEANQIEISLASFDIATLNPGVQSLQVLHFQNGSQPPDPRRKIESNGAPFILRPTLVSVTSEDLEDTDEGLSGDIVVTVSPPVAPRQPVVLLLNERSTRQPAAYSFDCPRRADTTTTLRIAVRDVKAGEYLVRLQVDGAESLLTVDTDPSSPTFEQYNGPTVVIS
jgi:hypothetical protein